MRIKRLLKNLLLIVLLAGLCYGIYYCWFSFPVISGYNAKNACSCAFIQRRSKAIIQKEELGAFPLSLAALTIDYKDSSVTASVLGLGKRKAVFRYGFGCTLLNDVKEQELRSVKFPSLSLPLMDSIAWPDGDQVTTASVTGFDKNKLDSALAIAFEPQFAEKEVHTRALLIVHQDSIVAEQYAPGYNLHSKFLGWSMAKSVTSALVGILVKKGMLDIKAPAPVPEWKDPKDKRHVITTEHLLQQTSGLDFVEDYGSYSDVTNMLFNKGDMGAYTASRPLKQPPGTLFYYSSGNSNILSRIIRNRAGEQDYISFPYKELFYKIGMYHSLLEPDASGTYVGSSYIYASARDYARFGLLYLHDGVWKGERILPAGWVKASLKPSAASPLKNYGYQFWLNGFDARNTTYREYPSAPADLFLADGYGGQRIYMIPSLQLVVVRMGLNKFDEQRFLEKLIHAFQP